MKKLIIQLEIIKALAKDLHYTVKGSSFWSNHKLMDKIHNNLGGLIDDIKENYFMGSGKEVPLNKEILKEVSELIEYGADGKPTIQGLLEALKLGIYGVEEASRGSDIRLGDQDLLGRISGDLCVSYGLLCQVVKE